MVELARWQTDDGPVVVEVDPDDIVPRLREGSGRPFTEAARGAKDEGPSRGRRLRVCQAFLRQSGGGSVL